MIDSIINFDVSSLLYVQENIRCSFLSNIFIPLTKSGDYGFIFILAGIVMLCFSRTRKTGIIFLSALAVNFIITNLIIKNLVMRTRPYEVIEQLSILIAPPHGYAFPSAHTSAAFACITTLYFTEKKVFPYALVFAILMGLSRIYVGVHYPSDVFFGAVAGILVAYLVYKFFSYFYCQFDKK